MDAKTKNEILLTALSGLVLNGYSKSFRADLHNMAQDQRIEMMKMILQESKQTDEYLPAVAELIDLAEMLKETHKESLDQLAHKRG